MEKYYVVLTFETFYVIINILYNKGGILIKKKEFLNWYSSLEKLRDFEDVVDCCADTQYCTNCKFRIGCPIRPMFYLDDMIFEVNIQIAEAQTQQHFQQYGFFDDEEIKERSFVSYDLLKNKRQKEIAEYPQYSEN